MRFSLRREERHTARRNICCSELPGFTPYIRNPPLNRYPLATFCVWKNRSCHLKIAVSADLLNGFPKQPLFQAVVRDFSSGCSVYDLPTSIASNPNYFYL